MKVKNKVCDHDWAYEKGHNPLKRECQKCKRVEVRDMYYVSLYGYSLFFPYDLKPTEWYVKLKS